MLGDAPNAIPIYRDLAGALARAESLPDYFMFGMAPSTGMLTAHERGLLIEAMSHGFNIVSRMHEFLNDDPVFAAACVAKKVGIVDVRRPRDKKDRRPFSGQIHDVTCPRIAVLGTVQDLGYRAFLRGAGHAEAVGHGSLASLSAATDRGDPASLELLAHGQTAFTHAMQVTASLAAVLVLAAAVMAFRHVPSPTGRAREVPDGSVTAEAAA